MSIKEALIGVFSDDPINWLKWGIVFAILIGGYIIAIPLYGKVSSRLSWERKRDIARSRDHVIKAALVKKHPKGEVGKYDWSATYHYELQGEEREYETLMEDEELASMFDMPELSPEEEAVALLIKEILDRFDNETKVDRTTAFKAALNYVMQQDEEAEKSIEGIAATLTVLLEKVLDEESNMEGQDA